MDGTDSGKPLQIHVLCVRYNTPCILCICNNLHGTTQSGIQT